MDGQAAQIIAGLPAGHERTALSSSGAADNDIVAKLEPFIEGERLLDVARELHDDARALLEQALVAEAHAARQRTGRRESARGDEREPADQVTISRLRTR